ncbi:MAG: hypothetical protein CL920_39765 [Deltaproteobacteria bacterium]|mgnify:CR=1 FL=1|nr:hypothetical protein [Deltaproteobacteria bacterium]
MFTRSRRGTHWGIAGFLLLCAPFALASAPSHTCPDAQKHPGHGFSKAHMSKYNGPGTQKNTKDKPPIKAKGKPAKVDVVSFTTREGTWMNLTLSPDGKWLVFDLLGDIYKMSSKGGDAKRLTKGTAWDTQPRFSPDGKWLVFTSDRSGSANTWMMDVQGKQLRQLTHNHAIVTNSPVFSPDGQHVITRRRITDRRSIGVVELWMHHILGGKGLQLTSGKRIGDANEPAFSPDGKYLYFSTRGRHRYNRNPHQGIWNLQRLDIQSGHRKMISRGASRPHPSPDGRYISLIRRIGKTSAIQLHDLRTGAEHTLTNILDRDQQEGFAMNGTYPAMAWSRDSKMLYFTAKGTFWKLSIKNKKLTKLPFKAKVEQHVTRALRTTRRVGQKAFQLKILRWPQRSSKGDRMLYGAIGRIYSVAWPPKRKQPKEIKHKDALAYAPAFARDGRTFAYVTWSDTKRGHVWVRSFGKDGTPTPPKRITQYSSMYLHPSFSPDQSKLVFISASGADRRGLPLSYQPWLQLQVADLKTGKIRSILTLRSHGSLSRNPQPRFSKDGKRIFFTRISYKRYRGYRHLCSVRLDGSDEKKHFSVYAGEEMELSPDQKWLLFKHLHQIYVMPTPPLRSKPISLRVIDGRIAGSPWPIVKLSKIGGNWPSWGPNNQILWSLGREIYTLPLSKVIDKLQKDAKKRTQKALKRYTKQRPKTQLSSTPKKAPSTQQTPSAKSKPTSRPVKPTKKSKKTKKAKKKKKDALKPTVHKIRHIVKSAEPSGCIALTHATIITMHGKQVIQDGTLVLNGSRIHWMGPSKKAKLLGYCKKMDMKGKYIIPGFIDVHSHMHYNALEVFPKSSWEYYANLAYGVTTTHDPSASTELVFGQSEMVRAGVMVGPRIYSTGFILYGAENTHKAIVRGLQDARHHMKRLKKLGAFSVKSYMQPRRIQRQWVLQAAREEKMLVYPEGGGNLQMNLNMVLDGHTGIEHAFPVAPLYKDVVQLVAQSKTGYTPTFLVAYGGLSGEIFFYQHDTVWNNKKLTQFYPPRLLNARARWPKHMVRDNDWHFQKIAESAKKIIRSGGQVQIGAHGQLQGLGVHWEIFSLAKGGLTPHEVLRAATYHGATYLGLQHDIGSIQKGKLADLVILDKNPLKDIHHIRAIRYVVKNGFIYKGHSMDRVWPTTQKRPTFFWQQ